MARYTDRSRVLLEDLTAQHDSVLDRLDRMRPHFASLQRRAVAGEAIAHAEAHSLATGIVNDERLATDLAKQITAVTQQIAHHETAAAEYFTLVEQTRKRLTLILAQLTTLDAELTAACELTRELDRRAGGLLSATQDRQFRRSPVDPRGAVLCALRQRVEYLERWRPHFQPRLKEPV